LVETALLGAEELLEGSDRTSHKYLGAERKGWE
jgi:hypothetical protein